MECWLCAEKKIDECSEVGTGERGSKGFSGWLLVHEVLQLCTLQGFTALGDNLGALGASLLDEHLRCT